MQFGITGQTICPHPAVGLLSSRTAIKILFIMRVSIIMMGLCTMAASLYAKVGHAQKLEDVRISLQLNHVSLKEKNQSVTKILQLVFRGRDIQYKQVGVNIILKKGAARRAGNSAPSVY